MDTSTYLGQCQLRHPQWQQDLLALPQQFPPLFKRLRERSSESPRAPEAWLQDLYQAKRVVKRHRPDQYEMRLKVWDAYRNSGKFSTVARLVGRRTSTVRGVYLQAGRDILGPHAKNTCTRQQRLLQGFDPINHGLKCPTCSKASCVKEMRLPARIYASQDARPERGRPYHNIDTITPAR
jgi:hypothetical protein